MNEPIKCYAVTSGSYSDYNVHAIYRRREDAEERVRANNSLPMWSIDGVPIEDDDADRLDTETERRLTQNPAREELDHMRVEEFDYYEGEPLPAALEER